MRYRKKPVTVEAFKLGSDPLPRWAANAMRDGRLKIEDDGVYVETLEGTMRADFGAFIIKGVDGELYPCRADIFYETYERVRP